MPKRWLAVAVLGLLLAGCVSFGSNGKRVFESDTEFFWRRADPLLVAAVWQDAERIMNVRDMLSPVVTYNHMYLVTTDDQSDVMAYTQDANHVIFYRAATDLCSQDHVGSTPPTSSGQASSPQGEQCGPVFYEVALHEYLHVVMLRQGIPFARHHCLMLQKGYVAKMSEAIRARFPGRSYDSPHAYRWHERFRKKCAP